MTLRTASRTWSSSASRFSGEICSTTAAALAASVRALSGFEPASESVLEPNTTTSSPRTGATSALRA